MEQKYFSHSLLKRPSLSRIDRPNGERVYITPEGQELPSVTTVLKKYFPNDELEAWKQAVGEEESEKIMIQSRNRGLALHEILEKYMINNPFYGEGAMPINLESFWEIQGYLNNNISWVFGIEFPLYSHFLKTAGTADLICSWNKKRSIFDLKTSRKPKKEKYLLPYFIQATCYSYMHNALFPNKPVEQIVIGLIIDNEKPEIYIKPYTDYLSPMIKIFREQ